MEEIKKIIWKAMNSIRDSFDLSRCTEIVYEAIYYISCINSFQPGMRDLDIKMWYEKLMTKLNTEVLSYKEVLLLSVIRDLLKIESEKMDKVLKTLWKLNENQISLLIKEDSVNLFGLGLGESSHSTKKNVADLAKRILDINPNDKVLDLCSGEGTFLVSVLSENYSQSITGVEINPAQERISQMRLSLFNGSDNNIIGDDVFKVQLKNRYDKIFSDFPSGMRIQRDWINNIKNQNALFNWFNEKSVPIGISSEWVFVLVVLSNLTENGKAVILLNDTPLLKAIDSTFRTDLIKNGMVEKIIKLPKSSTFVQQETNMVVLSRGNKYVKLIDATNEIIGEKDYIEEMDIDGILKLISKENDERIKTISNDELLINTNYCRLDVGYYVGREEINYYNPQVLKEYIIDIYRGISIPSSVVKNNMGPDGEYEILSVGDIEDDTINTNLKRIKYLPKCERYVLEEGDVVITAKGTILKIVVADNLNGRKVVPTNNIIVIRLDKKRLNPYYLKMYLSSADGKIILNNIQTDRGRISINPSSLSNITISTMNIELQNDFAQKYIKVFDIYLNMKNTTRIMKEELDNYFDIKSGRYFLNDK